MRVHELAKKLEKTSKELIAEIQALGGDAKNHMSLVSDEIAGRLTKSGPQAAKKEKTEVLPKAPSKAAGKSAKVEKAPEPLKVESKKTEPKAKEVPAPKVVVAPAPAVKIPEPLARHPERSEGSQILRSQKPLPQDDKGKESRPQDDKKTPPPVVVPSPVQAPKPVVPVAIVAPVSAEIQIQFPITVGNLAAQLKQRIPDLIKALMGIGIFANVNQLLNEDIVKKLAGILGITVRRASDAVEEITQKTAEDPKLLKPRPPVVTMMGHVDHGKTSLLDAIRKTKVAAKEAGFITQHIGAYGVDIPGKGHVTFLDTPGHEAFTAMRARGANATDVVVLVVAADDGVMPQTIEAADHAREAGCPIVVAINKSDLPSANPQKVMTGLQKIGLMPEEWGGKTICMKVSAKTGKGIDELLEMLLLEAEVLELKANPDRLAMGTVIESHLSKGTGPIATVIVQKGTLRIGDIVVSGPFTGRVRALRNDRGKSIKEAGPSYAAELSGLNGVPETGSDFFVVEDEKTARRVTEQRLLEIREREMRGVSKHLSLEDLYHKISSGNFKELKLILKADVQGSVEALGQSLEKISTDKCRVHVIHGGVGGINESDIMLAVASEAIVIGFHVKASPAAQDLADKEGVDTRFYSIIYEVVDDVRKAMEGLLEPTYKETVEGRAEIRKTFTSSKAGTIGGSYVVKGKIARTNPVRLIRDQVVIFEGKLAALKRFKDDVRDVAQGYECGISLVGFSDLRERDIVESYKLEKIAGKL